MKKTFIKIILVLNILLPTFVFAYPSQVILGGDSIGIELRSNGVYIVGFYKVDNKLIGYDSGFRVGDIIKEINNRRINNIIDINNIIKDEGTYSIKVLRKGSIKEISLSTIKYNDTIKTGLYVKDKITGIGTLSYINPETHTFASLGHEILESNSMSKFNISDGAIYSSSVRSIRPSSKRVAGAKTADIYYDEILGIIKMNEVDGIYGKYSGYINNNNLIDISTNIENGSAYIRTVIDDKKIDNYKINILDITNSDPVKNIFFEIVDDRLLNKTGGIIQGMSGSPIIQNDKMIGVVNYVLLDNPHKGYGIFIEKMLKEGDRIN